MTSQVAQKELRNHEDGKSQVGSAITSLAQQVGRETHGADNEVRRTMCDTQNTADTIGCTQFDGTIQLNHTNGSSTVSSAAFVTAAYDPSHPDLIA